MSGSFVLSCEPRRVVATDLQPTTSNHSCQRSSNQVSILFVSYALYCSALYAAGSQLAVYSVRTCVWLCDLLARPPPLLLLMVGCVAFPASAAVRRPTLGWGMR